MRTNIEIDDDLVAAAMRVAGTKTKRETVAVALRALVEQEERLKMLELRGNFEWVGDLDAMRRTRTW